MPIYFNQKSSKQYNPNGEVNSVRKHNYSCMLDDGI